MVYSHIPTSFDEQNDAMVDEFRRAIERVPKPVYVHCSELPRAAAMLMMHHATHAGMTGGEILAAWKDQYGFEPANETMEAFIRDYVNRRKEEG
jgi:protein tyrosine phosphatase (PTP) superfamily phosphohydrolase (DUF442 family)